MMRLLCGILFGLVACGAVSLYAESGNGYAQARKKMVEMIQREVESTQGYLGKERLDPKVVEALLSVPRHLFVPPKLRGVAYENRPLPIGYGQTISQPFIVALMTHLLDIQPDDRILEIGTGSGYQAAIAAELASQVYTVEIISELAESADKRLKSIGYTNVLVKAGDGWYGWPEAAPFDGILVTAVAPEIPPQLLSQLAVGGRLVIPVGHPRGNQELVLITRLSSSEISSKDILPVRFVPMTGEGILTLRDR
jgi:protein-L-isoaspartate(D-aspartate) O-methyltransferase